MNKCFLHKWSLNNEGGLGVPNLATQDDPFQFSKFAMLAANGRLSGPIKLPSAAVCSM